MFCYSVIVATYRGIVVRGRGEGKLLGYPTANIKADGIEPGIYSARVTLDGKAYDAAAFVDDSRAVLEAHILDFSDDIYGKEIQIELVKKMRSTRRFANGMELKKAIAKDVADIRIFLKNA